MDSNSMLNRIRQQADAVLNPHGLQVSREELAAMLARNITALDKHLSGGGTPPEAWREGPDAPELDEPEAICPVCHKGTVYDWHETWCPQYRVAADPLGPIDPAGVELPGIVSVDTDDTGNYVIGVRYGDGDHDLTAAAPVEVGEREL